MRRKFRLTRSTDFQRVRRSGISYAHPLLVLIKLPNEQETSRFGIAAGRSLGSAVQRNRAKRLVREALRANLPVILPGWDLVIIARKPMLQANFEQTKSALVRLLQKARLLQENHDI